MTKLHKYQGSLKNHDHDMINSLGYRGDEYNESLPSVFVCGCSHTFGVGLDYKDTWVAQIKPDGFNIMNFAQGGGSNQYITRTLIKQCEIVKPELVIAHYSYIKRTEYFDDIPMQVGDWLLARPDMSSNASSKICSWAQKHYAAYLPKRAMYHSVCQMLLLQTYCDLHKIPLLMMCCEKPTGELSNMLRVQNFSIHDYQRDKARDGQHAGVKSNKLFADKILKTIKSMAL